jgi:phthalate 4,5-cis-dihydrodiol dehydrogenase
MADGRKVRVGLLGLGMAGGLMAPYFASHPGTTVAGAADRNARLRERFERDFALEADAEAEDLIRRQDIDAVYIATPHQFHRDHAVLAAEHGKHIVVEKPMALTVADCDAMIDAARRNHVVLMVGHTHSFDPAVRYMAQVSRTGEFGRLAMIAMWNYTDFLYRPRRPEELDTSRGGGIMYNQVPHQVDIARLIAGSPLRSVRAASAILDPGRPTEGCCTAILEFENRVAASLVYSGYDHFDSDELNAWVSSTGKLKQPRHGSSRRALSTLPDSSEEQRQRSDLYGYGGNAFTPSPPRHQPHFGLMVATYEGADVRPTPGGVAVYSDSGAHEVNFPPETDGRSLLVDELCQAVLNDVAPVHDGAFGRGTVEASIALLESARHQREVLLR